MNNTILWIAFVGAVVPLLALDLGVFHRKAHVVRFKEALVWSVVWITLAMAFAGGVFYYRGTEDGINFLTGYIVEKSLSVDNVFLFAVIFTYFAVPPIYQHRVLFWGVMGAVVMRAIMITGGAALIKQYGWIVLIFGVFLIFTGIKMFLQREEEPDPSKSPLLGFLRRRMRVTNHYDGQKFFTHIDGKRYATPLFLTLVFVEFTDLIFAVDSIPAIFSITTDPFIVFTSNIFAILGLRALYFLLAGVMDLFRFLKVGLSVILVFVGVKMLIGHMGIVIHPGVSLGIITCILAASISASLLLPHNGKRTDEETPRHPDAREPIPVIEPSKHVNG